MVTSQQIHFDCWVEVYDHLEELHTTHFRHVEVKENDLRAVFLNQPEAHFGIAGGQNANANVAKGVG